ncbi:hypothetical protein [Roseovarius sp.]|uniref:hypothetical protein n=1 Tax=Roseovarius sp. TaxID=1486281 RepID=UPI003D1006B5
MTQSANSRHDDPSSPLSDPRHGPPAHKCRAHRKARRVWGQGLLSGLPFAEIVLLAGFLLSAGMFLTIDGGHATSVDPAPNENTATR